MANSDHKLCSDILNNLPAVVDMMFCMVWARELAAAELGIDMVGMVPGITPAPG